MTIHEIYKTPRNLCKFTKSMEVYEFGKFSSLSEKMHPNFKNFLVNKIHIKNSKVTDLYWTTTQHYIYNLENLTISWEKSYTFT